MPHIVVFWQPGAEIGPPHFLAPTQRPETARWRRTRPSESASAPKPPSLQQRPAEPSWASAPPGHWKGREDKRAAGLERARESAARAVSKAAQDAYADLFPLVKQLRTEGKSFQAIADELNRQGHTTRRGSAWNPMQVRRVLKRAG